MSVRVGPVRCCSAKTGVCSGRRRRTTPRSASPQAAWAEQDPEDWWRASQEAVRSRARDDAHVGREHFGDRPLRTDARRGAARRSRRGGAAGDHLVRSAHRAGVPMARPRGRRRTAARAHRQSRADQLHADETAVGPHPRAGAVEPRAARAAAEGLRPLPAERRVCHRRRGRLGHADARRRRPEMVAARSWMRSDIDSGRAAAAVRVARGLRARLGRGRRRDRAPGRHPDRRGRRRPGGRRRGHGHHPPRHRERHDRDVGRCLCRNRPAVPRSGRPPAYVLSRRFPIAGT